MLDNPIGKIMESNNIPCDWEDENEKVYGEDLEKTACPLLYFQEKDADVIEETMVDDCSGIFENDLSKYNLCTFLLQANPGKTPPKDLPNESFWGEPSDGTLEQQLCAISPSKPIPPDISKGLGQHQAKQDLVKLEEFIVKSLPFMVYQGTLCMYTSPCWQRLKEQQAERIIRTVLENAGQSYCLTKREYKIIYEALLINPKIQSITEECLPEHKLNFLDGTYDLHFRRLLPHDPADLFFSCINVAYKDIRHCPGDIFEAFVQNISNGDPNIRSQLLQLIALTIFRIPIKYFFVLLGPSNTGKTQFGRFLEELVGRDQVACVRDVRDFADRWTVGSLSGKMLATCLDLPNAPLPPSAVGIIKQFVGDDPVKGERKYQEPFTIYQKPLLLLAGNYSIRISKIEEERALLNRMVIIPFQNPVDECNMRRQLYKDLLEEAPYIIGQAIDAYYDLEANNFQITRACLPQELQPQDARERHNAVARFTEQYCCYDPDSETSTEDLFRAFCSCTDDVSLTKTDFARCLSEVLSVAPNVAAAKRTSGTDQRGYRGIRLND